MVESKKFGNLEFREEKERIWRLDWCERIDGNWELGKLVGVDVGGLLGSLEVIEGAK